MTAPLTAGELREIEERANAATPRPWTVDGPPYWQGGSNGSFGNRNVLWGRISVAITPASARQDEDTEFIAHARTDVPRLLDTITHLRGLLLRVGRHPVECLAWFNHPLNITPDAKCTCGLDAALASAATEAAP